MAPIQRRILRQPAPAPTENKPARRSFTAKSAAAPAKRAFTPPTRANTDDGTPGGTGGWGGYKLAKESAPSKWEKRYEPPEEGEGLIKFLEDAPYASLLLHWPDWIPKGQKPLYICLKTSTKDPNADCPLCAVGDVPNTNVKFNVVDLGGEVPVVKVWGVGITITDTLMKFADNPKSGPLSNLDTYYAVSKSGGKRKTTQIRPIKSRDLADDFGFSPPLTKADVEKYLNMAWDESSVQWDSEKDLQGVAEQMNG